MSQCRVDDAQAQSVTALEPRVAGMLIIERPPTILYSISIVHMLVVGSTQFGAQRGVVCDFIPVVLNFRTTPTLETFGL
jgi:hypothetical protein